MTNESTKQPLGLAFLSWDLVWDSASVFEQGSSKRPETRGENGAISWTVRIQGSVI